MRLHNRHPAVADYEWTNDFGGFPTRPLQTEWDSPVERSLLTDQPWPGEWDSVNEVRFQLSVQQRAALRRRITQLTANWFGTIQNKQELAATWELLEDSR